jgi:hypothetical protein
MHLSGTILQMWQTEERHRRHPGLPDSTCLGVSAILCLHPLPGGIHYYPVTQKEWGSVLLTVKDLSNIDTIS